MSRFWKHLSGVPRSLRRQWVAVFAVATLLATVTCGHDAEEIRDWPNGKTEADYPETADDYFHDMDGAVALTPDEIKGRNTWMVWTGGNAGFWDWLARYGYGTNDLLKTIDSRNRGTRFAKMGLVNEPGYSSTTKPDAYGLYIDEVAPGGRAEPFDTIVNGRSTGVVGLRLFPNPAFDDAAKKAWSAEKYYSDPNYSNNKSLVRPYTIGMACSFCHVQANPIKPPADPENPAWENLSTNIGNQYFRTAAVFGNGMTEDSFVMQMLMAMEDGTLDTSFLATDNILNPSNMNALFEVGGRLSVVTDETMGDPTMALKGQQRTMKVPHILKDGADGVGLHGALSRVYINIGEFWQEWIKDHNPLVGGTAQRPFSISNAQKNSVFWVSSENRVDNLAKFFLKSAKALHLADAPGGAAYITKDSALLHKGATTFAQNCARCHSSKRPADGVDPKSPEATKFFEQSVMAADFRDGNYLSTDQRIPVSVVQTNACRALGTNATAGHVWDNFSSATYKATPADKPLDVRNPLDGTTSQFTMPGGGVGFYRVPSLVSIWATAPFLHNNSLGTQSHDPSVAGRMRAFDDATQKLLWPEKRLDMQSIKRTTATSYLWIPQPYLPVALRPLADSGYLRLGPIPKGTPVSLLANLDMTLSGDVSADLAKGKDLFVLAQAVKLDLLKIKLEHKNDTEAAELLRGLVPRLLKASKCPDFVEDRGHLFGTKLTDPEKKALIEFLKTL